MSSLKAYLTFSKIGLELQELAEELGYLKSKEPIEDGLSRLIRITNKSGIKNIRELNNLLLKSKSWGKDVIEKIKEISIKNNFEPFAVACDILIFLIYYARKSKFKPEFVKSFYFVEPLANAIYKVIYEEGQS